MPSVDAHPPQDGIQRPIQHQTGHVPIRQAQLAMGGDGVTAVRGHGAASVDVRIYSLLQDKAIHEKTQATDAKRQTAKP